MKQSCNDEAHMKLMHRFEMAYGTNGLNVMLLKAMQEAN
jgi:hypothetical protein